MHGNLGEIGLLEPIEYPAWRPAPPCRLQSHVCVRNPTLGEGRSDFEWIGRRGAALFGEQWGIACIVGGGAWSERQDLVGEGQRQPALTGA